MQKNSNKIISRRFLNGTYLQREASTFFEEIKSPKSENDIEQLTSDVWGEARYQTPLSVAEKEKYKQEARLLLNRMEKRNRKTAKYIVWTIGSAAAIIALFFTFSYFLKGSHNQSPNHFTEIYTSFGERKQIALPDGSTATLNACSQLRYPDKFSGKQRNVELQGEAYFDVAKNPDKPFVVATEHFDIRVLGTAFNVKSYNADDVMLVNVERGSVEVEMPDAMVRLHSLEQVTMNTLSGELNKQKDNSETAVWRKGWLRFNSTPVRDVARELERVYNCQITFEKGQEFNNLISGEHDNKSLEAVLQSLEFASGIKYRKTDNAIILYK